YSTLFFRTGIAYKFDIGRLKSASANQAQKPASEEVDKLVGKIAGLVFDAERSLGMTVDRLREYWRRAELIELSDMCSIIGYPDLVAVTMFFLTDGKVTNVTYSFGNYDAKVEAVLKLALIQRFDSPRSTGSDGRSYWVDRTTVFALGKEKYPEAESGYILTLVCFQP
ncbi:MAG: hypothetical protein LBP80_04235, partial [Treponema sp.]|nr:hypothetical protein [Treponema sp.]